MKVHVYVSTMNGFRNESYYPSGDYLLHFVNQGAPCEGMINIDSVGLSKSRNAAISHFRDNSDFGDVILLSDNDCHFIEGFEKTVCNFYSSVPNAEFCSFKALNADLGDFKNNYKKNSFKHGLFSLMRISSIEISFRVTRNTPQFDIGFGLGSDIPVGEENIFATDFYKSSKSEMYFCPIPIVKHMDDVHSGSLFSSQLSYYRFKVFFRIFGYLGPFLFFVYLLKNFRRLDGGFLNHIRVVFRG